MDTYQLKRTPIEGVWQLGQLDPIIDYPSWSPYWGAIRGDYRVHQLLSFLDPKYGFHTRHYKDPQATDVKGGQLPILGWHVDNYSRTKTRPSSRSKDMVCCIAGKYGTWFVKPDGSIWMSKPWTILLLRYDAVHCSPLVKETDRFLTRYDLRRGRLNPQLKKRRNNGGDKKTG